jgi:uncharacterized protein (TIGR02246 family)
MAIHIRRDKACRPGAPNRTLLAAAALWVSLASCALAGPREEALSVVDKWAAAFTASDVDGIVKLYAPDALFLGTGSTAVVTDPAGVRAYFERGLLSRRPRGAVLTSSQALVLSDTAVVVTGLDETSAVIDGATVTSPGRVTFVVAKRGRQWLIVHFHRSAMPK